MTTPPADPHDRGDDFGQLWSITSSEFTAAPGERGSTSPPVARPAARGVRMSRFAGSADDDFLPLRTRKR